MVEHINGGISGIQMLFKAMDQITKNLKKGVQGFFVVVLLRFHQEVLLQMRTVLVFTFPVKTFNLFPLFLTLSEIF